MQHVGKILGAVAVAFTASSVFAQQFGPVMASPAPGYPVAAPQYQQMPGFAAQDSSRLPRLPISAPCPVVPCRIARCQAAQ